MKNVPKEVRAVRIFPKSHNFPLVGWCIGSLCQWLSSRRMPLFIWHTELDWPSLYLIAKGFPDLPLVVETQVQKILYHTRPLFALMRDCRNVSLELSNFAGQGFVEYASRELGAERLIFGSFLPVNDPLVAMGMVIEAEISREEKALIARENLRRLIGEA
jgi:predicted TIM-barrel fold metal-dependent hydrolase